MCGSCYLQPYSELKEKLPLAKPGWQRRKHNASTVPDQVNSRVGGNKINLIEAEEMIFEEKSLQVKSEAIEVAMDLSLSRPPMKRVNSISQNLVPPKKRIFVAQTASCSNNHHLTIPAPPRRPS